MIARIRHITQAQCGSMRTAMAFLAKPSTRLLIFLLMANDYDNLPTDDPQEQARLFRYQNWFESIFISKSGFGKDLDPIYIRQDGGQKYINAAVIGAITIILLGFMGVLVSVFTGIMKV